MDSIGSREGEEGGFASRAHDQSPPSGQEEGGFAWLTLNYLLGKLGRGPEDTVAAIDLGGGSVSKWIRAAIKSPPTPSSTPRHSQPHDDDPPGQ